MGTLIYFIQFSLKPINLILATFYLLNGILEMKCPVRGSKRLMLLINLY